MTCKKRLQKSQLAKGANKTSRGKKALVCSTTYEDKSHRNIDIVATHKTATMKYQGNSEDGSHFFSHIWRGSTQDMVAGDVQRGNCRGRGSVDLTTEAGGFNISEVFIPPSWTICR